MRWMMMVLQAGILHLTLIHIGGSPMPVLDDYRWPAKGDRLFPRETDEDLMTNACLNFTRCDAVYPYGVGYRKAGEILLQWVLSEQRDQDFLVYPIVFLFRHHVELMLKQIIVLAARLREDHVRFPRGHDLASLWAQCKARLMEVSGPETTLEVVESLVDELGSIDPGSDSFRYHLDGLGRPTLPGITHINLHHFALVMDGLTNFLDACHTQLTEENRWKEESQRFQVWDGGTA